MKCCCVIGGSGFIGSYVVRVLIETGRRVVVIGRNVNPTHSLPAEIKYITGDFGDKYFLNGIFPNVDEIIDLAYASVPKTSYDNPVQDIFDNLPSAVNMFEVASRFNVSKVVFVSSGGVIYGHTKADKIFETHPTNPISPYGITKLAVEKYAQMAFINYGLPVLCVRPANAYGEGQRPFAGQGFIATAMGAILSGRKLTLFGEHGTIRDYIHASDIASGIVAALNFGCPGEVYNIGSGIGRSNTDILDVLAPLAQKKGLDINVCKQPLRSFDVPQNVLDSTKLSQLSGWSPRVSFNDGLVKTWDWFVDHKELYLL